MARSPDDPITRCLPRVSWPPRDADCSGVRRCATSSYMRKWMTERLKRRKKPGEGSAKEATNAPEPLQPRFYDNEPDAPPAAPVAPPVVESRRPPAGGVGGGVLTKRGRPPPPPLQ